MRFKLNQYLVPRTLCVEAHSPLSLHALTSAGLAETKTGP